MNWTQALFGFCLVRVRGHSMEPTLCDGDLVIAQRQGHGRRVREGDVVYLHRPKDRPMIKRLGPETPEGAFALSGDGVASAPSIDLGTVSPPHIRARALARVPQRGWRISGLRKRKTARS